MNTRCSIAHNFTKVKLDPIATSETLLETLRATNSEVDTRSNFTIARNAALCVCTFRYSSQPNFLT
jgi:hypothetical protein